jgi:hypothetical protein
MMPVADPVSRINAANLQDLRPVFVKQFQKLPVIYQIRIQFAFIWLVAGKEKTYRKVCFFLKYSRNALRIGESRTAEPTMKQLIALISLSFLCVANVQGQILIYKMTVNSTVMGHGFTTKRTAPGYLVVDTATGAAAEFDLNPRAKDYSFRSKAFTVSTVHGGAGKNYMVFAEAGANTDTSGQPFKFSSTFERGRCVAECWTCRQSARAADNAIYRPLRFLYRDRTLYGGGQQHAGYRPSRHTKLKLCWP